MANCLYALHVKRQVVRTSAQARTINLREARRGGKRSSRYLLTIAESFISYVASLESRVDKLEKKLAFARLRKASVAMHEADDVKDDPAERKDSMATIRAAIHGKAARRREATDVNELVSDFGFL